MADVLALGPWGNEGVRNWSFRFFEAQTLAVLKIRHGDVVDRITFVLMDENHHTSEESAGGEGGESDEIVFNIGAGEFITHISGTSANYSNNNGDRCISSITIHTNLNKSGYGPYGPGTTELEDVKDFSSPPLFANAIVGFHGGANQYLESIGIYVNPDPVKLGPWGNTNSLDWDFKLADDQVVKKIKVRHAYVVDAIGFVVGDQNSDSWEMDFGGDGGNLTEISLSSGAKEYVTQLSGTVANYSYGNDIRCITSITIHTNLNPDGYGPYGLGRKEGEYGAKNVLPFSSPLMDGDAIVGFHGGANKYLEAIGIYVAPMGRSTSLMKGNK